MKNATDLANNKEFSLADFKPAVEAGRNRFCILNAEYDKIPTKNGEADVLRLEIELSDEMDSKRSMVIKNYNEFINITQGSTFHLFTQAVIRGLNVTTLKPTDLVGKRGSVNLYYHSPENSDRSFEKLNNWIFDFPSKKVNEKLQQYLEPDDFALTEKDIEFGGTEE